MDRRALLRSLDEILQSEKSSVLDMLIHFFGFHTYQAEQQLEAAKREVYRAYKEVDSWNSHFRKTSRNPKQFLFATQWEDEARRGYQRVGIDVSNINKINIARPLLEFTAALCGAIASGSQEILVRVATVEDPFTVFISKFASRPQKSAKVTITKSLPESLPKVLHLPGIELNHPIDIVIDSSVDFHTASKRILLHVRKTRQRCKVFCIGEDTLDGVFAEMGEVTGDFRDQHKSGQHRVVDTDQFSEIKTFLKKFSEPEHGQKPLGRIIGGKTCDDHSSVGVAILRGYDGTIPPGIPSVSLFASSEKDWASNVEGSENISLFTTNDYQYIKFLSCSGVAVNDICDRRTTAWSSFTFFTFSQHISSSTLSGEILRSIWYPPYSNTRLRLQNFATGVTPPWEVDFLGILLKVVLAAASLYALTGLVSSLFM